MAKQFSKEAIEALICPETDRYIFQAEELTGCTLEEHPPNNREYWLANKILALETELQMLGSTVRILAGRAV